MAFTIGVTGRWVFGGQGRQVLVLVVGVGVGVGVGGRKRQH